MFPPIRSTDDFSQSEPPIKRIYGPIRSEKLEKDVSPYKWKENGMIQKPDHVHVVDAPDAFRGKFTGKTAATDYADQVQDVLEENKGKVAAFIGRDGQSKAV